MAGPITWQQVAAPNFSGVTQGVETAGNLIGNGFGGMAEALGKFNAYNENQAGAQLLANAAQHKDLGTLQQAISSGAILNGVNPSFVPMEAWKALDSHASNLIANATGQEALNTNLRTQDSRVALAAAQPANLISQTGLNTANAGHLNQETRDLHRTEGLRDASVAATTRNTNATAGQTEQATAITGRNDEDQRTGADLAAAKLAQAANPTDATTAILNAGKSGRATLGALDDAARAGAAVYGTGAPVPVVSGSGASGAISSAVNPTVPIAPVTGDWKQNITPGSDSSGKVNLDRLHEPVKNGLAQLSQTFGPLTINSSDAGGHTAGSQHYQENAVDVSIKGYSPQQLNDLITKAREAGFTGFGIGGTHLHLDTRETKNGAPVVFPDSYSGPVAGKDVAGWQETLSGIQPNARPSAEQSHYGFLNSLGTLNQNLSGAQAQVAQSTAEAPNYAKSLTNADYNVDDAVRELKGQTSETYDPTSGKRVTVKGNGAFSDFSNIALIGGIHRIQAMAAAKGFPINVAQAKDLLIQHGDKIWAPGSDFLHADPQLYLDNKGISDEIDRMASDGKDGRYQQNQENVKVQTAISNAVAARDQAIAAHNAWLQAYNMKASGRNIPQKDIDRLRSRAEQMQKLLDQATATLGTRSPKLKPSEAAEASWEQAAGGLGFRGGAAPTAVVPGIPRTGISVDPRNPNVAARLYGAFQ